MTKKKIINNLEKALLEDGHLELKLYQWELEEHVPEYFASKKQDQDKYFIAITEHTNDVAMLLIDDQNRLHINEQAKTKLKQYWKKSYNQNVKKLIPQIAQNLFNGYIFATGIKEVKRSWQAINQK
ncbi:MAG: hypothetical protein ACRC1Z_09085 [Waterburya sp.]